MRLKKFVLVLGLTLACLVGSQAYDDEPEEMITSLPPLFSGLEANSNLTLVMLLADESEATNQTVVQANRVIRRDMVIEKATSQDRISGAWLKGKLTRFYETCLEQRQRIEIYSPASEHKSFLTDDEHYGAEWHQTLAILAAARYDYGLIPRVWRSKAVLAGEAGLRYHDLEAN